MDTLNYLGTLLIGGNVVFLTLAAIFFFFLVPLFKPRMNEAARSLIYSEGWVCAFNAFSYLLWVIAEFIYPQGGIYEIADNSALYHILIYVDLMALPISMQIGYAITTGKRTTFKQFAAFAAVYIAFMIVDTAWKVPYLFEAAHFLTVVLCAVQLAWYWKFIHKFDRRLLEICSNIDGRKMNWYLWIQVPLFAMAVLYIPLCYLIHGEWADIVYDGLFLLVMIFVVAGVFVYRVDDMTMKLIAENFKEVTGKELDEVTGVNITTEEIKDATEKIQDKVEVVQEAIQGTLEKAEEATAVQSAETTPAEAQTEESVQEAPAFEIPAAAPAPVVEVKSYDFTEQMKKLEAEHFYLNPDVNIDWLTRKLGTNRHYVSDYMSRILHMTFYEYVNSLRLQHAERLITSGREKVNQVAYSSGFNSDHTFRRLFKERYGCTPTQYLKQA